MENKFFLGRKKKEKEKLAKAGVCYSVLHLWRDFDNP